MIKPVKKVTPTFCIALSLLFIFDAAPIYGADPIHSFPNIGHVKAVPALDTSGDSFFINTDKMTDVETPILDSILDQKISQANSTDDIPVLREGMSSSPSSLEDRIDSLTAQVLLKEIELERYGIHYDMEVAKQGRWKGWRYALFQEANYGLGLGGGIISTWNRGSNLHTPSKVRLHPQEAANYIPEIGAIIGASAAALEFGINGWHEVQTHRKGFSPGQARKKVQGLRDEIDSLLAKRAELVKVEESDPSLVHRIEIDKVEDLVLRDMRDQKLQMFERFHLQKRRLFAFQQSQYLFDIAKNVTNAIGYECAYLSLARRRRVWNGRAGVFFVVSGGLTIIAPVASRLFGKVVAENQRRLLRPTTQTAENATLDKLKADRALLDKIAREKETTPEKVEVLVARSGVYAAGEKRFEEDLIRSEKARDKAKLTATENIGAGFYVGASKIASGILFIIPGFDRRYNSNTARAGRVTNDLLFASAVVGLPATTFSILDTLRININGEIARHRQLKQGVHPTQLAKKRLEELDKLEQSIKAQM